MHKSNVEFKIIKAIDEKAIAKLLISILEPVWEEGWHVVCDDPCFWDDLLWTVTPISFLPHGQDENEYVFITKTMPRENHGLNVLNLTDKSIASGNNIIEIVNDNDEVKKQLSRDKYKHYKQSFFNIITTKL